MAMKYACLRCKRKKVKCDKAEPVCHQCVTAKTECQYVERRQRPRLSQQRIATASLNQRLELLEQHIGNGNVGSHVGNAPQPPRSVSTLGTTPTHEIEHQEPAPAENSPSTAEFRAPDSGEDSWIYQMATDTQRQFQSQATSISTPTPQIDNDMSALNDALEDLRKLRLRADLTQAKGALRLTPEEAREGLESFFEMTDILLVPSVFPTTIDFNLLRSLPYLIDSRYVSVDPGVYVMYFAAIHYGLTRTRGPRHASARTAYFNALKYVPAWLESPIESDMDGHTATMSSWIAIDNLDYQLSWKFHLKACHYLKRKGIDNLDVFPAKTFDDEEEREPDRHLFWQVVSTGCLFRLFWGKPTMLRWNPRKVRPPAILNPKTLHVDPSQAMLICVWISYTSRAIQQINSIDEARSHNLNVSHEVDECCRKLETTIVEWKLEAMMIDKTIKPLIRSIVTDHIMNIYALIAGLKRLTNRIDKVDNVDALTIRAARKIVDILLNVNRHDLNNRGRFASEDYFIHFINFYPFCAVFTLYEHIVACTNPNDCEEDVHQLERVGEAMEHSSKNLHPDLKPFSKTIKALNKVSRTIQDGRWNRSPGSEEGQSGGQNGTKQQPNDLNTSGVEPDLDSMAFDMIPDFPMTTNGEPDPLGFVRAMENDFIGRNWNENWWDAGRSVSSGMDSDMNHMSGR